MLIPTPSLLHKIISKRRVLIVNRNMHGMIQKVTVQFPITFFSLFGDFSGKGDLSSKVVLSMVFHLQKVSSQNSHWIKSYGCFKRGYKWHMHYTVLPTISNFDSDFSHNIISPSRSCCRRHKVDIPSEPEDPKL